MVALKLKIAVMSIFNSDFGKEFMIWAEKKRSFC